jgi:glycosyltransferase involved in cell wall biosynthesis
MLAKKGYEVSIFLDSQSFDENLLSFSDENIRIFPITKAQALFDDFFSNNRKDSSITSYPVSVISRIIFFGFKVLSDVAAGIYGKQYFSPKKSLRELLFTSLFLRIIFLREILFARSISNRIVNPFNFFIGSDARGLIVASLVTNNWESNLVYYNLELLLESECTSAYERVMKCVERELNKTCKFTIIPDSSRADHLIQDNGIDKESILFLPVSALGEPITSKSQYFRTMFGIDPRKKIVLQAGNIADWTCCYEIAQSAISWPEHFVFVIHTWRTDIASDPDYLRIKKLVDNKKIFFSDKPVTWDNLPELLSSADFGIAFYKNLGKNYFETGLSSNKIAQYLQVGLPVITSDYPTFFGVIDRYRCGKCTSDMNLLGDYLEEILSDYSVYRQNAFTCFREVYDFSSNFEKVFQKLKDF